MVNACLSPVLTYDPHTYIARLALCGIPVVRLDVRACTYETADEHATVDETAVWAVWNSTTLAPPPSNPWSASSWKDRL